MGSPTAQIEKTRQRRKSASHRSSEILTTANAMLRNTGALPLSMPAIAEAMGVSRGLIYSYFPDHDRLINALTTWLLDELASRDIEAVSARGALLDRITASANIYMSHIIEYGNGLHIILRDGGKNSGISSEGLEGYYRVMRNLSDLAATELRMTRAEVVVLSQLLIAMPEEAAHLVSTGVMDELDAKDLCHRLIAASLEALEPH